MNQHLPELLVTVKNQIILKKAHRFTMGFFYDIHHHLRIEWRTSVHANGLLGKV
ncbi:MAG: hypothetical protein Q7U16_04545 [Agitococcus sp.]|nr:hypothetical protein [Agitococcus sp.]